LKTKKWSGYGKMKSAASDARDAIASLHGRRFEVGRISSINTPKSGVNFINVLRTAFTHANPESVKRYWWNLTVSFYVLRSTSVKAAHTTLVKLTLGASSDWAFEVIGAPYVYNLELRDKGRFGFLLPPGSNPHQHAYAKLLLACRS